MCKSKMYSMIKVIVLSIIDKSINNIIEFSTIDTKCAYKSDQLQRTHYKYIENCSSSLNNELIDRGWRRFGRYYSRPICANCNACESIKVDVEAFKFTKSQRRIIKKNKDTNVFIQTPTLTTEHIKLYNKFHKYKSNKSGWEYNEIETNQYYTSFVDGFGQHGKEVLYFIDNKLVGVDLIDILDDGISSIYFYYDPDYSKYSLGAYSLFIQFDLAKRKELPWVYLGYYVEGNSSLSYKATYKPYKKLLNTPDLSDNAIWIDT